MKTNFIILLLLSIFFSSVKANTDQLEFLFNKEKPVYYNNELMEFKIVIPEELIKTERSIVCELSIQDANGTDVLKKLIYLEQSNFVSTIKIPANIVSGKYLLYCSLVNEKFSKAHTYQTEIYFVNIETYSAGKSEKNPDDVTINYKRKSSVNPLTISGKVVSKTSQPLVNPIVILQSRGVTELFTYTKADGNGRFNFNIPFFGDNEISFHIVGAEKNEYAIEIMKFPYPLKNNKIKIQPYRIIDGILNDEDLKNQIIKNSFDTNDAVQKNKKTEYYIKFDKTVYVKDYVELPTTLDIVKEIVPLKKIRKRKEEIKIFLLNGTSNSYFKKEPLILIDGFIVNDFEDVLDLKTDQIESISTSYYANDNFSKLGRYCRYGILAISTKSNNYSNDPKQIYSFEGLVKSDSLTKNNSTKFKSYNTAKVMSPTKELVASKYDKQLIEIEQILASNNDLNTKLSYVSATLKESLGVLWVGFYSVKKDELALGPFQGSISCIRIKKGEEVSGVAWLESKKVKVNDITSFNNGNKCSKNSKSEIALPAMKNNDVALILNIKSDKLNGIEIQDEAFLDQVIVLIEKKL